MRFLSSTLAALMTVASVSAADAAQPKATQQANAFGLWAVQITTDKMTDKDICRLKYAKDPRVWIEDEENLVVDLRKFGGPTGYQYRFGTAPAKPAQLASPYERDSQTVRIWVPTDHLAGANRVLVQGSTLLRVAFETDIDLTGMPQAKAAMLGNERCKPSN